mmetsp:Transcript_30005/g.28679  ORF Transcript_30005/g.28679 Transcript_30005/m.28679 type:complete len:190 (-) Transcript_30005:275-844(-)
MAAAEIAKAAVIDTNKIPVDSLDELRCIHGNTNVLIKTLGDNVTTISGKITEVTTAINDLKTAVTNFEKGITNPSKVQTLQFALLNTAIGEFKFGGSDVLGSWNYNQPHLNMSSKSLVSDIIMNFMRGKGHFVEGYIRTNATTGTQPEQIMKARTDFENALCTQIHGLTGTRPVIRQHTDTNRRAIYYE